MGIRETENKAEATTALSLTQRRFSNRTRIQVQFYKPRPRHTENPEDFSFNLLPPAFSPLHSRKQANDPRRGSDSHLDHVSPFHSLQN